MFIWTEAGYQLFRNKGRSILLVCASLLLCGCIAFYIGNIAASRRALENLSESTPAIARVSNVDGNEFDNLTISYTYADILADLGLGKIFATCQASGYLSQESLDARQEARDRYDKQLEEWGDNSWFIPSPTAPKGDTAICGVTNWETTGITENLFTLAEGFDLSALEGNEPVCLVSDILAEKHGIALGDELSMPMSFVKYDTWRTAVYLDISKQPSWTVIGTYPARAETSHRADLYVPAQWMREFVEEVHVFSYTSFEAALADSMQLNQFKDDIREYTNLGQPFFLDNEIYRMSPPDRSAASTLYMDDEDFIRTAEKLGQSIRQYEAFLIPFFAIVVSLVTLAIFLVLRGCRRDMAIACSLGRPKLKTGAAALLAALAAELAGALLSVPVSMALTGLGPGTALLVCGAFLLCALLGDVVGLLALLRFDALALLTASD